MNTEYLYLLRDQEGSAFKIGVSRDPRRRSVSLPQAIDFDTSLQIAMNGGRAYIVERLLHYWFRDHAHAMPRGDGSTEWFSMEVWPDVLAFIEGERVRLGLGEPQPIQRPTPPAPKPKDERAGEKQRMRRAEIERQAAERIERNRAFNERAAQTLRRLVRDVHASNARGALLVVSDDPHACPYLYLHGLPEPLQALDASAWEVVAFDEDGGIGGVALIGSMTCRQDDDGNMTLIAGLHPAALRPSPSAPFLLHFRSILLESFPVIAPGHREHAALLAWHEAEQRKVWAWG